jgi:hypothetical protein
LDNDSDGPIPVAPIAAARLTADFVGALVIRIPVGIWTGFWFVSTCADMFRREVSAIQQAADASAGCLFIVAGYVVGRTLNFIVRGL